MNSVTKDRYLRNGIAMALVLNLVAIFVLLSAHGLANAAECALNDKPDANAGSDQSVQESKKATLDGSAKGLGEMIYEWNCNGGTIDNISSAVADFTAPEVDRDTYYVCTLKATNDCGFDYDTVNILVENKPENSLGEAQAVFMAQPDTGCAPLNDVSLNVNIIQPGNPDREYIYYFYCNGDVDLDKTVTTHESSFTASDLCDYPEAGTYNAYVRVASNNQSDIKESVMISAETCEKDDSTNITVKQLVSNLKSRTDYSNSTVAEPLDELSFKIALTAAGQNLQNVFLTDVLPEGIDNILDVIIDGKPVSGDLEQGINLGNIEKGATLTITFTATVQGPDNFIGNEKILINTAKALCSDNSCSSDGTAQIIVTQDRTAVVTNNETGFGDNPITDSFLVPAGLSLLLVWLFRVPLIRFEEWTDARKQNYFIYRSKKLLNLKRARLKVKKLMEKWL
jgi:uncharacterized repeat protein (TIGR01451 family)